MLASSLQKLHVHGCMVAAPRGGYVLIQGPGLATSTPPKATDIGGWCDCEADLVISTGLFEPAIGVIDT